MEIIVYAQIRFYCLTLDEHDYILQFPVPRAKYWIYFIKSKFAEQNKVWITDTFRRASSVAPAFTDPGA